MEIKNNNEINDIAKTEKLGEAKQYRFVKETIIDRKTKIKQGLAKTAINLLLIVGACVVTSFIFLRFIDERQGNDGVNETTNVAQDTSNDETSELSTNESDVNETPEEKVAKRILASTMEFRGYSIEKFTNFIGVVISKSSDIIAITNADNLIGINNFGVKVSDNKEVPIEVVMVDNELHIAYLKIKKEKLTAKEIGKIVVSNIAMDKETNIGEKIKYIGWGNKAGMTLIDGKIVSQGATQVATDINYNKYMVDISLNDLRDGFVYDIDGNLMSIAVLQEENGKVGVIDLTTIRNDIYTSVNKGYLLELGIISQQVTEEVENLVGMELPEGIFVTGVENNSPAYDGGIMVGDVVYKIDNTDIHTYADYRKYLNTKKKGDTVVVHLYRRFGSRLNPYEIRVVLGERK